jgi:hypothetical protein
MVWSVRGGVPARRARSSDMLRHQKRRLPTGTMLNQPYEEAFTPQLTYG